MGNQDRDVLPQAFFYHCPYNTYSIYRYDGYFKDQIYQTVYEQTQLLKRSPVQVSSYRSQAEWCFKRLIELEAFNPQDRDSFVDFADSFANEVCHTAIGLRRSVARNEDRAIYWDGIDTEPEPAMLLNNFENLSMYAPLDSSLNRDVFLTSSKLEKYRETAAPILALVAMDAIVGHIIKDSKITQFLLYETAVFNQYWNQSLLSHEKSDTYTALKTTAPATRAKISNTQLRDAYITDLWNQSGLSYREFSQSEEYIAKIRSFSEHHGITPLTKHGAPNTIYRKLLKKKP